MRVIAGSQKGRRLMRPAGPGLRPTSDRVREALFSILSPRTVGARFLDLYAGTGAIGIEALSRGAQQSTFVESHPASLLVLRENLSRCGLTASSEIRSCPASLFLKRSAREDAPYDIVFADPPYHEGDGGSALLSSIATSVIITDTSLVVLEHFSKMTVPPQVGRLVRLRQYRYGDTTLSVFRLQAEGDPSP
ncbi:MAG: 16S rRNA (guanine(966)-N(2))-methyltransferase RsmD [Nitrospirae bacterium]|nr:16S rRNA (guanine(966)-N(2))-methyltransferase RsmD [Nitrospirota bacterium]